MEPMQTIPPNLPLRREASAAVDKDAKIGLRLNIY